MLRGARVEKCYSLNARLSNSEEKKKEAMCI